MSKKLGQHFLVNKEKIGKIVEALDLKAGDTIVEIGPGHGELTEKIKNPMPTGRQEKSKIKIIAIEKDEKLVEYLRQKFRKEKNIEIIHGDALKIIPRLTTDYGLQTAHYKLTGNIPYYITGYLFRVLGELKSRPFLIVLTIQKEVAERICVKSPKMNLLAASVQFWAEPEIIDYISKKDFRPAPKVDSAILRLSPMQIYADRYADSRRYYQFIKILFKQPRKTILNNLESRIKNLEFRKENREKLKEKLESTGINPFGRSQDLSIEQIIELSTLFQ